MLGTGIKAATVLWIQIPSASLLVLSYYSYRSSMPSSMPILYISSLESNSYHEIETALAIIIINVPTPQFYHPEDLTNAASYAGILMVVKLAE